MTAIYFILLLSAIVLIHELGHLLAAKSFGVYCHEFSFGFGPKLFSFKGKETLYSIRALPFGGYVRMAGEEAMEGDVEVESSRTLDGISPFRRMVIMLSGIIMNLVLTVALFSFLFLVIGYYTVYPKPIIASVLPNSAAEKAGFQENDRILSVTFSNGMTIHPDNFYTIIQYLQAYPKEATYEVLRDGAKLTLKAAPVFLEDEQRYFLGVTMPEVLYKKVNVFNAWYYGGLYSWQCVNDVAQSLLNLARGRGLENLSGPVAIYQMTDETMSSAKSLFEGVVYFTNILAVLSLNVGIFNLLPIPLLDGGRVLLSLVEVATGKPLSKRMEYFLINGSAILIMLLFVFIMWNDISKLFN